MTGIGVIGLYVHDQDEALEFYTKKLGFEVHTDAKNGTYRWLTIKHPNQQFELGLFLPQEPVLDAATAQTMREMVAKARCRRWCSSSRTAALRTTRSAPRALSSRKSRSRASAASTPISVIRPATPGR